MHKEVNHKIRKHFNEGIYNVARYTEIVLSIVILIVIALAGIRLIYAITETSLMDMDIDFFATARQMVVEHMAPTQTLIGVIAIAVLFAIRKFLMTEDSDMSHSPFKKCKEEKHEV